MAKSSAQSLSWKKLGRVAIFIDAANVIYSLRDLGWRMDYKKLMSFFQRKTTLVDAYFYTAYFDGDGGRKDLLEMLSRKGYTIRSKAVKTIRTKDGILHKANCDVELTMDAMTRQASFDTCVLMSGDSDFAPLIKFLQAQGKKVITISTRGHVAREIVEAADPFLHFSLFRSEWELTSRATSKNPARRRGSR